MKEIYLDNAATTSCDKQVLKVMEPYWSKTYGNPFSFNDSGREAKKAVDSARKKIALLLGAKSREMVFTSSATESNNLAIFGTANRAGKKNHIITTAIEHHSVLEPIRELEKRGFKVTYLSVDKEGLIDIDELGKAIKPETILISVIYANNEIGSVQPVKKIAKAMRELKTRPCFHVDAAQAQSRLDLNVNNLGVDLMTLSSHKVHGPKGIAGLYVRQGTEIEPLIYGGGQERSFRSSTEAVPLIVGFAEALEITNNLREITYDKQEKLREYLVEGMKDVFPEVNPHTKRGLASGQNNEVSPRYGVRVKINGPENPKERVPHIVSATFRGIENEQMLLQLDRYGIRASAGSACTSSEIEPSHVLRAIGLSKEEARSTVRFSFSRLTRRSEVDYLLKVLPKVIGKLQKIYPKEIKKHYYR